MNTFPNPDRKRSKAEERAFAEMMSELENQELELDCIRRKQALVPADWYQVHNAAPTAPAKKKITIRLDNDILEWYRSLGRGWQPRMNAVLRAYMKAVIAKEIEQTGDRSWNGKAI